MFQEEKKKINYAGICLFCFFCCVFTVELITFANSYTRATVQQNLTKPEPTAEPTGTATATANYVQNSGVSRSHTHNPITVSPYTQVSGTVKSLRQRPPSSYCLKIQSFNTLAKSGNTEKYESRPFKAGGYNWTFILYPKGNKNDNGDGYISLYVAIDNSSLIAAPSEVYADLKFFVYNKKEDKYLTIQDTEVRRFHVLRTVWGFSQVLSLETFNDPKNGYLYDGDHCVFGVDVFVAPLFDKWELFSITEKFYNPKFTWTVKGFSKLDKEFYLSNLFSIGGRKWSLKLYPNGDGIGQGNSLSLYVMLASDEKLNPYEKIYLRAKLRVLDQKQSKHVERLIDNWYDTPGNGWGYRQFVSFTDLRDTSKGLIVNDSLKAEVEFEALSETKYFPS